MKADLGFCIVGFIVDRTHNICSRKPQQLFSSSQTALTSRSLKTLLSFYSSFPTFINCLAEEARGHEEEAEADAEVPVMGR